MPKFVYQVPLTDGSIAKRTSHRVYTHLIEISPRTLESFVEEMNGTIAYYQSQVEEYRDTDFTAIVEKLVEEYRLNVATRGLDSAGQEQLLEEYRKRQYNWYNANNWALIRERHEKKIAELTSMRDVAIADGHPTVGNYFASNWCGSYDLAVKKMNSADVRWWTDKGRTARIVPTPSAE